MDKIFKEHDYLILAIVAIAAIFLFVTLQSFSGDVDTISCDIGQGVSNVGSGIGSGAMWGLGLVGLGIGAWFIVPFFI